MTGIFLSYRKMERSYAPMFADWVLRRRFGQGLIFEAGHVNQPAVHFPTSIQTWLERADILVAFIDPPWIKEIPMLADPDDWVRKEILHFLESGKPILPILLDGARMPRARELPAELAQLTKWIGLPMSPKSAEADLVRLIGRIEQTVPDLVLAALERPVGPPPGPAALLNAEQELLAFRPRPELGDLVGWARSPDGPPVRLLVGAPASGKTRLALRLCAELRGTGHPAVMLPASATAEAVAPLASSTAPLLLVVDDADTRPEVAAAVRAVAGPGSAARVLLVARGDGEWLDDLRDDPDDAAAAALDALTVVELAAQRPEPGDFATACQALGIRLGLPVPPGLTGPDKATTLLEVQAAALAALDPDGAPQRGVWARIAGLERSRWTGAAEGLGLDGLRPADIIEIMAMVTIFGAATEAESERLFAALRAFQGRPAATVDAGRTLARTMLPGPLALNPVGPQPLADEIIARHLEAGHGRLAAVIEAVGDDQARTALIALGRCLATHPGIGEAVGAMLAAAPVRLLPLAMRVLPVVPAPRRLGALMAEVLPTVPPAELELLVDTLPQRGDVLADFAADLTRRALAASEASGRDGDATARLGRLLAVRLAARGGPADEAIAVAEAAVKWFAVPGRDRADACAALALALDLRPGSADTALRAGAEAIALLRASEKDADRAALATALLNQAHRAPHDPAPAAEALDILRSLHEKLPTRYRSVYADAAELTAALTGDEALGREALRLRKSLAAARPDAFRAGLATALFNLSVILGSGAEARNLCQEAHDLFAELAAEDPARFGADLARVQDRLAGGEW